MNKILQSTKVIPFKAIVPRNACASPLQSKMTSLQIVSDIHLEVRKKADVPIIQKYAPNLALLGDIGKPFMDTYKLFLHEQSQVFDNVFVIMGNHEYYHNSKTANEILVRAKQVCSQMRNVHLLERESFDLTANTRLLGCTLWSAITKTAAAGLSDMRKIHVYKDKRPFRETLDQNTYLAWHARDVLWIQKEMEKALQDKKKLVVLTHHGPLMEMTGQYAINPLTSAFVSDLKHLFTEPVLAFASGHVHSNVDTTFNKIRSVSNAVGYKEQTGYRENVVINIP